MIIVGVDGSEESKQALRWGLDEAKRRGSPVRAIHAWHYPLNAGGYPYVAVEAMDASALRTGAESVLEGVVEDVLDGAKDVDVQRAVRQGPAAKVLIEASDGAEMLVVGSRGRGGFAGLMLGSVSQQCAHHAHCPVVIVREPRAAG
jgi:nucleotide-binding universal stress UspA family protein